MVVVSCAGDIELTLRLRDFLRGRLWAKSIEIEKDELIIDKATNRNEIKEILQEFLSSSDALSGYTLTQFEDVFTIGIMRNIDEILIRCENCGYVAHSIDELIIHKRIHAIIRFG